MSVRNLTEEYSEELDPNIQTVPEYLQKIAKAIVDEQDAIKEYDDLLETPNLPDELRSSLEEIRNDEKDHMVILADIIKKYSIADFPNNTEELSDVPDPDTELIPDDKNESILREESIPNVKKIIDEIKKGSKSISYELWDDDYLKILSYLKNSEDYVSELGNRGTFVFVNGKKQITVSRNNIDIEVV